MQTIDTEMKSTPKTGVLWLLVGSLSLAALAVLVVRDGVAGPAELTNLPLVTAKAPRLVETDIETPKQADPIQEREYLDPEKLFSTFYGDQWATVQAQLFPDGLAAAELQPIVAWREARELHKESLAPDTKYKVDIAYRSLMAWPTWDYSNDPVYPPSALMRKVTPESIASCVGEPRAKLVSQVTADEWDLALLDINTRLDGLVRSYLHAVGRAVRAKFTNDLVDHAPIAFPDQADYSTRTPGFLDLRTSNGMGWATRVTLSVDEYPDLAVLMAEIKALKVERQDFVRLQLGF
jgi:hypothetical protein